jgi:hypothetical protein
VDDDGVHPILSAVSVFDRESGQVRVREKNDRHCGTGQLTVLPPPEPVAPAMAFAVPRVIAEGVTGSGSAASRFVFDRPHA